MNFSTIITVLLSASHFSLTRCSRLDHEVAFARANRRVIGASTNNRSAVRAERTELSPFRAFEESVTTRIRDADDSSGCVIFPDGTISDLQSAPLVVHSEIVRLCSARNDDETRADRLNLATMMKQSGGYLIVKLSGSEAKAMSDMWACAIEIFDMRRADNVKTLMRHQRLTRDDDDSSESGYDYVETTINRSNGNLDPEGFSGIVGREHYQHALNAHRLLENLGEDVAAIMVSATGGVTPRKSRELVRKVSDDGTDMGFRDETPSSCSVHRLSQYVVLAEGDGNSDVSDNGGLEEVLRSHTDWTVATIVPVSDIAGLEIWQPSTRSWIRPELTAKRHWEMRLQYPGADDASSWNSRYVVVMAGKWLQILTNGGIESAIHRVVSIRGERRMSAPFFLRPRQTVPLGVQREFGEAKEHDMYEMNDTANVMRMQRFLRNLAP